MIAYADYFARSALPFLPEALYLYPPYRSTVTAFQFQPPPRLIDRLRLYGYFSPSVAPFGRGAPCAHEIQHGTRLCLLWDQLAKTAFPPISDSPTDPAPPQPRQRNALQFFSFDRKKYKPIVVLGCTRLTSCRFVNVIFHLARTADKTTDFLSGSRKGKDEETASITLRECADVIPSASLQRYLASRSVFLPPLISNQLPPTCQCYT